MWLFLSSALYVQLVLHLMSFSLLLFFPELSLSLQKLLPIHLPHYWPFRSLLSQSQWRIFTKCKQIFQNTKACLNLCKPPRPCPRCNQEGQWGIDCLHIPRGTGTSSPDCLSANFLSEQMTVRAQAPLTQPHPSMFRSLGCIPQSQGYLFISFWTLEPPHWQEF